MAACPPQLTVAMRLKKRARDDRVEKCMRIRHQMIFPEKPASII
jgi:hypothetical protein